MRNDEEEGGVATTEDKHKRTDEVKEEKEEENESEKVEGEKEGDRKHRKGSSKSLRWVKVSKGAKIRNRYNQGPHLTQDTNGKVTNSQLDTTNKSQEVSPFPAGDHKAQITDTLKGITNTRQNKKCHKLVTNAPKGISLA